MGLFDFCTSRLDAARQREKQLRDTLAEETGGACRVTPFSGDGGKDVVCVTDDGETVFGEAKDHGEVSRRHVEKLADARDREGADRAVMVANGYRPSARKAAERSDVETRERDERRPHCPLRRLRR